MFNLLRMDLYRIRRSKSPYVGLAFMLTATLLTFMLTFLIATPEGQRIAVKLGMTELSYVKGADMLTGMNTLGIFHHTAISGGMYSVLLGVIVSILVCADFMGGYIKNIMSLCQERWKYIGSKLMAVGIMNAVLLVLSFLFNTLLDSLFHNMVPYAAVKDIVFYLFWLWLITTAFAALVIFICVSTRSITAGVLVSVLLGGGIATTPLASIMSLFHAGDWFQYTIYQNISVGPLSYGAIGDLKAVAVGLVFLLIYSVASSVCLARQDI